MCSRADVQHRPSLRLPGRWAHAPLCLPLGIKAGRVVTAQQGLSVEKPGSGAGMVAAWERGSRAAGAAVALLGLAVLAGWLFGIERLTNPAQLLSMKPNTALSFVLLGVALALASIGAPPVRRAWRVTLALFAASLGMLSMIEYVWRDLGVDQLLFRDTSSAFTPPGRMAFLTALSVLALGSALAMIDVRLAGGHRPSEWLAMATLLVALIGATDYALDWQPDLTRIAIHTVIGFLVLSAGVMAARPDEGWMRTLTSERGGAAAARRLLPFAIFVPLSVGALRWAGHRAGVYDVELGLALMTASTVAVLVLAVWWNAWQLNQLDERRVAEVRRADEELRHTNRALRAINNCGQALVRATSEAELLDEICRVVVEDGGYRTAWV